MRDFGRVNRTPTSAATARFAELLVSDAPPRAVTCDFILTIAPVAARGAAIEPTSCHARSTPIFVFDYALSCFPITHIHNGFALVPNLLVNRRVIADIICYLC
jgi:hypothetical protein